MRGSFLIALLPALLLAPPLLAAPVKSKAKAISEQDLKAPPPEAPSYTTVLLQGLNKVTGRVQELDGPVGTVMHFGNLEIIARRCWKAPPEERPENAALLEISELKPSEAPTRIFLGWMFSSSPGLSGLEHPVYDITVVGCGEAQDEEEPKKDEKKEEKKDDKKEGVKKKE